MILAIVAVFGANLIWGLSPVLAKVGLLQASEISFLFIRFGLSTLLFSPVIFRAMKKFRYLQTKDIAIGVLAISFHYYLQVYALKLVPVTWYVFFYSLCPILSLFAVRVRVSLKLATVSALAIFGTLIFINSGTGQDLNYPGLVALTASVGTWVLFTKAICSWQAEMSDLEVSGAMNFLSFCVFSILVCFHQGNLFAGWSFQVVVSTAILSIILPVAFFAYSYALRKIPSLAILGQYTEPLFGALSAMLILGEKINNRQILGAGIVLFSLTLLLVKRNQAA